MTKDVDIINVKVAVQLGNIADSGFPSRIGTTRVARQSKSSAVTVLFI